MKPLKAHPGQRPLPNPVRRPTRDVPFVRCVTFPTLAHLWRHRQQRAYHAAFARGESNVPRFVIERDIPEIGSAERDALREAAQSTTV